MHEHSSGQGMEGFFQAPSSLHQGLPSNFLAGLGHFWGVFSSKSLEAVAGAPCLGHAVQHRRQQEAETSQGSFLEVRRLMT